MKKWKLALSILTAVFTLNTGSVSAATGNLILLNYHDTGLGGSQVITEGTMLVPLKALANTMGFILSWDQNSKTTRLVRPEREVTFMLGSKSSKVNGVALALTKPPRILKGMVYVPLVSTVSALGGQTWYDKGNRILHITDEPRFTVASVQDRSYWISQKNGDVYYRASVARKPERIGGMALSDYNFKHQLIIKDAGKGTDLLLLSDNHYSMFNDYSNGYQTLVKSGKVLKQMEYHYWTSSYQHAPELKTKQLFMTDGQDVQYINRDGSLGKQYKLEKVTGQTGNFTVEYAADDVALVRSVDTTQLFAINTETSKSTNLSEKLINTEDRKEWDRADARDHNILSKMLVLTKRKGDTLTFTYTPLPDGKVNTVSYTLTSK